MLLRIVKKNPEKIYSRKISIDCHVVFKCLLSDILFCLWCLTPLSTIFQLYRGCQAFLVEETGAPGKNHQSVASHWQTWSHTITTTMAPVRFSCIAICRLMVYYIVCAVLEIFKLLSVFKHTMCFCVLSWRSLSFSLYLSILCVVDYQAKAIVSIYIKTRTINLFWPGEKISVSLLTFL